MEASVSVLTLGIDICADLDQLLDALYILVHYRDVKRRAAVLVMKVKLSREVNFRHLPDVVNIIVASGLQDKFLLGLQVEPIDAFGGTYLKLDAFATLLAQTVNGKDLVPLFVFMALDQADFAKFGRGLRDLRVKLESV